MGFTYRKKRGEKKKRKGNHPHPPVLAAQKNLNKRNETHYLTNLIKKPE